MHTPIRTTLFAAAAAAALIAMPALAAEIKFTATLAAAEEVPPNDSPGTGTLEATFDDVTKVLKWTITYEGLENPATAAHFHGPAAVGETADPVIPIEGDLASPISGEATLTESQAAELTTGMWYFNVHTDEYPDGEIRGQVVAATAM